MINHLTSLRVTHSMWPGPKRFRNMRLSVRSSSLKDLPDAQGLRDRPSLCKAAARSEWCITVGDFAQAAHAVGMDLVGQWFEEAQSQASVAVNAKMSKREGAKQPPPGGSLVVSSVSLRGAASVMSLVSRIVWIETPEAMWS